MSASISRASSSVLFNSSLQADKREPQSDNFFWTIADFLRRRRYQIKGSNETKNTARAMYGCAAEYNPTAPPHMIKRKTINAGTEGGLTFRNVASSAAFSCITASRCSIHAL